MNTNNKRAAVEASQRLLDQIVGGGPKSSGTEPIAQATSLRQGAARSSTAPVIALNFDDEGVMLVRSARVNGVARLEKVAYVPYATPTEALPARALFAAQALRDFAPDYQRCDLWTSLPESDVAILTLPKVKADEMDAVALLNANRTVKIDPQRAVFDYRIQSESLVQGVPQLRALGVSAPTTDVENVRAAFQNAGLTLKGLTSPKFAVNSIFSSGFEKSVWQTYAVLQIESDVSELSIVEGGSVVLLRTFNFGMKQFLSDVIEHLSMTDLGSFDEDPDRRLKRLAKEAERIFTSSEKDDENRRLIEEVLQANVDRAFKYIDRTFGYYERMENGRIPEGMLFISDYGISEVIGSAVEAQLGIPCQPRHMMGPTLPEVKGQTEAVRRRFKSPILFSTVGLSLADEAMPNLLELPTERRRKTRLEAVGRLMKAGTVALCAATALFGAWCGWNWFESGKTLERLEAERAQITEPLTADVLTQEMNVLAELENRGMTLLNRRRTAALLGELADIRGDDLYITGIEYAPDGLSGRRADRRQRGDDKATPKSMLTLHTVLYGNAQMREAALAEFINRLEGLAPDVSLAVQKEEPAAGGTAYVIRMTGSF